MVTWTFKTVSDEAGAGAGEKWYWRANMEPPALVTSAQLFATLDECTANARRNGFRGTVLALGDSLAHPIMLGIEAPRNEMRASARELASTIWV
jgi:hypothetical protein